MHFLSILLISFFATSLFALDQKPWSSFQDHANHNDSPFQDVETALVQNPLLALDDPMGLIPKPFIASPTIRKRVEFWFRIYHEFDSTKFVIFDASHDNSIYKVLDFSELKKNSRNAVVYEILRKQKIQKELRILSNGMSLYQKRKIRIQMGQKDFVEKGFLLMKPLQEEIESILEEESVPKELIALAMVESSFNPKAHSRAGAKGIWQFIPETGRLFLKIQPRLGIDERLSPILSSRAAARLLRHNYSILKSWPAAITAYHSGFTPFRRARRNGLSSEEIFRKNSQVNLGYAGKNYFSEVVAMIHVLTYFGPTTVKTPGSSDTQRDQVDRT